MANGPSLYFGPGIESPVKPKPHIPVLQVQHKDTQIRASRPAQTICLSQSRGPIKLLSGQAFISKNLEYLQQIL